MKNYKKHDPRMWLFYTKFGRIVLVLIGVFILVSIMLDGLKIV